MSDTASSGTDGGTATEGTETEAAGTEAEGASNQGANNDDSGRAGSESNLKADLANERKARQTAAKEASALKARLDKIEQANKTETEKALDKARQEGTEAATKAANVKIARMAIRAAAANKFADPTDADAIDPSTVDVDEDGNVDDKAVNAQLDALLKQKPHWRKSEGQKGAGSADQGARGSAAKPNDMNSLIRRAAGR